MHRNRIFGILFKSFAATLIVVGLAFYFDEVKRETRNFARHMYYGTWTAFFSPDRKDALKALQLAAHEHRIPPRLLLAISKIETAGTFSVSIRPRRRNGQIIGTARGLCQFIKATARAYRLNWETNNPYDQARACAKLLVDNAKLLKRKLKRNPKFSEIYLAHVFGAGKALRIIKAPSKLSVKKTIGSRALRANAFLANKKNAHGIRSWADRKMQRSIRDVKRFL